MGGSVGFGIKDQVKISTLPLTSLITSGKLTSLEFVSAFIKQRQWLSTMQGYCQGLDVACTHLSIPGMKETGTAWKLLSLSLSEITCPTQNLSQSKKRFFCPLMKEYDCHGHTVFWCQKTTWDPINKKWIKFSSSAVISFFLAVTFFLDCLIFPFKILKLKGAFLNGCLFCVSFLLIFFWLFFLDERRNVRKGAIRAQSYILTKAWTLTSDSPEFISWWFPYYHHLPALKP